MNKKLLSVLSVVFVVGLALLFFGCVENPTACTADAKVCPDGSAVGRVPPNCEFAPCPSVTPTQGCVLENRECCKNGVCKPAPLIDCRDDRQARVYCDAACEPKAECVPLSPLTAPSVSANSRIQVNLHLWSSGICSDRGPNGEVRAAERDYFAYNNGTVFFKHACTAAPSTKTISHAELETLARKVLALNTPEFIAENASAAQCVGGSGTLSIAIDGATLSFRDACGRSAAYANAFNAAENQLMNYFT